MKPLRSKKPYSADEFCFYAEGNSPTDSAHALGRLGVTKDRHVVSLVADGLSFVAGIGYTHYAAAFIANCRLQKGRNLLESSSMTIAAIARSLGYCSTAHFSSQFKLSYGITPRMCRTSTS